jgi:hypothetical protein
MSTEVRVLRRMGAFAVAATVVVLGFLLLRISAAGPQKATSTKDQIVRVWKLVSAEAEQDGKKVEFFGSDPLGIYIFDANGRFFSQISRSDLPKFASGNRYQGTPEENKAVVRGFIAYFGNYTVTESGILTLHMVNSSFPNFNGTDQKRLIHIDGDEMQYSSAETSFGASAHQVWKRLAPNDKFTR